MEKGGPLLESLDVGEEEADLPTPAYDPPMEHRASSGRGEDFDQSEGGPEQKYTGDMASILEAEGRRQCFW